MVMYFVFRMLLSRPSGSHSFYFHLFFFFNSLERGRGLNVRMNSSHQCFSFTKTMFSSEMMIEQVNYSFTMSVRDMRIKMLNCCFCYLYTVPLDALRKNTAEFLLDRAVFVDT